MWVSHTRVWRVLFRSTRPLPGRLDSERMSLSAVYFCDYVFCMYVSVDIKVKVKWSRYRPGVAQKVGRGIALLFRDCGTRRGWMNCSTHLSHFIPGKHPVPILQEAGWAPGPVWTGGKSRPPRDSIPDLPARSQSLYRLSYPAHTSGYTASNSRTTDELGSI